MSAFKKLTKNDSIVIPYTANKEWLFSYPSFSFNDDIKVFKGTNLTGSFNINGPINPDLSYEKLIYDEINHLFYQEYTQNLNTQSLASSLYYESASIYRPTSSYFIYDENPGFIKSFPTGTNEIIRVVSINPNIYGNKIKPGTFSLTKDGGSYYDDSNGNVFEYGEIPIFVGNIFYSHGLIIITNQDYVENIFPYTPIAYNDSATFYSSSVSKSIFVLNNDYPGTGNFNTSSIELYAFTGSFFTGSSGDVICNTSTIGTFEVLYSFRNQLGLKSNKARIKTTIINDIISGSPSTVNSFNIQNQSVAAPNVLVTSSFLDEISNQYYNTDFSSGSQNNYHNYTGSLNTSKMIFTTGSISSSLNLGARVYVSGSPGSIGGGVIPTIVTGLSPQTNYLILIVDI